MLRLALTTIALVLGLTVLLPTASAAVGSPRFQCNK